MWSLCNARQEAVDTKKVYCAALTGESGGERVIYTWPFSLAPSGCASNSAFTTASDVLFIVA